MALTTIDGVLCCPKTEFAQLVAMKVLADQAMTYAPQYAAEQRLYRDLGAKSRSYNKDGGNAWTVLPLSYLSDRQVIRELDKLIKPVAFGALVPKIGEENVDGEVWPGPDEDVPGYDLGKPTSYWTDENGVQHKAGHADISLVGPASLGGKIVLELLRRLRVELAKDDHAQRYATQEQLDQRVLQPPAENK